MSRFYITTPLYYVNDKPHMGTAYSTVIADILKRYHQLLGYESFLLTGTDEHGQKSQASAQKQNITPQIYCDQLAKQFQKTWDLLDISYDLFMRTTFPWHKQAVQTGLQQIYDKNLIYESEYKGWYCVSEETFYTSKDLVNGCSPSGKKVTQIQEKNYFFKMSSFQDALLGHILKNPNFIRPLQRKNEIVSFLKKPLEDLCISRPKQRLSWGVELPFNSDFVTYVWVDALFNYVTGIGYQQDHRKEDFQKWWQNTEAIHLIAKDILIMHCVYWPCLLMALDLPLPKTILAHGWLLNSSQEKMSKSQGDVMDPLNLLETFDSDSLRYYLVRGIILGNDSSISTELITLRVNEDLSNNLGNLLRRTSTMIHQHFNSQIPESNHEIHPLKTLGINTAESVKKEILALNPSLAIEKIVQLLNETNKYLEQTAPWKLVKTNKKQTAVVLRLSLELIYLSVCLLKPVMPKKMQLVLHSLSCPDEWPARHFEDGTFPKAGLQIKEIPPLFPRIKESPNT